MSQSHMSPPQMSMPQLPPQPPSSQNYMIGGTEFQANFMEWIKQNHHLYLAVFSTVFFIWAIYADKLPEVVRWQLSTTIGRMLLIIVMYLVYMVAGWIPAVLVSIAIALTWANRPLRNPNPNPQKGHYVLVEEPFNNIKKTKIPKNKWFVEKVLHENPKMIIEDRVSTGAVQEDTSTGSKRSSR